METTLTGSAAARARSMLPPSGHGRKNTAVFASRQEPSVSLPEKPFRHITGSASRPLAGLPAPEDGTGDMEKTTPGPLRHHARRNLRRPACRSPRRHRKPRQRLASFEKLRPALPYTATGKDGVPPERGRRNRMPSAPFPACVRKTPAQRATQTSPQHMQKRPGASSNIRNGRTFRKPSRNPRSRLLRYDI